MFTHPDDLIVLSAHDIRKAHPEISFPPVITAGHIADMGYLPIEQDELPEVGQGESVVPGDIRIEDGRAYQGWTVIQVPEPAIHEVTMRQARLALLQSELLHLVGPAIESMDDPARSAARIEWEYSQTVERHRPFVQQLGAALGLTDEQMDGLFELAVTL